MRSCNVFDSPRLLPFLLLLAVYLLSHRPVFPLQLLLPRCGGQIPCALPLMRTLAPLPSTTLSQVYEPNDCHISETTEPYIQESSGENGSLNSHDFEYDDYTIGMALSSPLFTQEREDDASRRRPYHSHDEGLSSSQSSSVGHRTGPVGDQFDSLISNVKENPRHNSENKQIRVLLERQREQILADCQAEIQKHEFQADHDRRSIQKLNVTIESQKEELHRAQAEERRRQHHEQLLKQNWDLREAHGKSLNEMEELKRLQGSTFDGFSRRNWSKIEILSLNSQPRFRNYRMKIIV